jgi:hypothetical protein
MNQVRAALSRFRLGAARETLEEELLTAAESFLVEAERLVRQLLTESDRI